MVRLLHLGATLLLLRGLRVPAASAAQADDSPVDLSMKDLANLSLDELTNVKVTSASKKEERLSKAPAAIFVVTSEDIRRGGFTSIPEALRMVPGLYVARINADHWSVSARGFSDYLNNKMLVLVDGRNVYDPSFGGVEWDQQEVPMEDIDRIEVIRGPGGTLWGVNAVTGRRFYSQCSLRRKGRPEPRLPRLREERVLERGPDSGGGKGV